MVVELSKIVKFCKLTISTSPLFFLANFIVILVFAVARFCITLSFKLSTNVILDTQKNGRFGISVIWIFLLLFFSHNLGGGTDNFNNMIIMMCTNKAKKLFNMFFMIKSYGEKQDSFYDSNFYNNYSFVKEHIESTTAVSVTIFNKLAKSILSLIITVTAITVFSPFVLLLMVIIAVSMIIINRYSVKKRVEMNRKYVGDERKAAYFSDLLSDKSHAKELRIFRLKKIFLEKWAESFRKYEIAKYKFESKTLILSNIPGGIQQVLSAIINFYFLYLVYLEKMTVGDFTFLYGMMLTLMAELNAIIDIFSSDLAENYEYIDKYEKFTGNISKENLNNLSHYKQEDYSLKEGNFQSITLKNISYTYPSQNSPAVEDVNLKIRKGEIVSLLGYNGSGKSTLSKLMCGLLDDYKGEILLNGKNIREVNKENLYQYFGIGFQDFTRYSVTLKDNIGFGMIEKISEEGEIQKAVRKGNLQEIIDRLPQGIDTIIGKEYDKSGQELSGGQWQRIILSRAYMGEPEFLILDEPTAAIDPLEEMRMLSQFKGIVKGKTALLISHRIGFARLSDRICVMEKGHIVEDGTHEELVKLHGRYYELFTAQQKLYAKEVIQNVD